MNTKAIFDRTDDISDHFVGVFLGGEVRAGYDKRYCQWQAYLLKTGPQGGVASFKVLRTTDGQPIKTHFFWEGVSDLVDQIEALYKAGRINA